MRTKIKILLKCLVPGIISVVLIFTGLSVFIQSCQKEYSFTQKFSLLENSTMKSATFTDCETQCINPSSPVYYEKLESKTITWGGAKKPKSKTVEIVYYNTLTHFVLKVKSTNGWNDLIINDVSSWNYGSVAENTWAEYSVELPTGWAACNDYNFSLQVTGNGPPALFDIFYKLIAECKDLTVTDVDGNIYKTVTIGTQVWMAENLKTTKFSDGTSIYFPGEDITGWLNNTTGAYSWYNNDELTFKDKIGAHYNWYAVSPQTNGNKNLCPDGWHIPSDNEWKQLEMTLGMTEEQANALGHRGTDQAIQIKNTTGWASGCNGTNTSGFSAIPTGYHYSDDGRYDLLQSVTAWWTSTDSQVEYAYYRQINWISPTINRSDFVDKNSGLSVRCLKNSEP